MNKQAAGLTNVRRDGHNADCGVCLRRGAWSAYGRGVRSSVGKGLMRTMDDAGMLCFFPLIIEFEMRQACSFGV